ncbi:metal dependent phosphohydrolase [Alkaliphilus metalliredigens QYMF]|uniref:Metal dependent phosphohydrolase n=1 Tax=Alkaliphilus metalliredigens (strain QYMF) TaxID=293826 RepID=A6TL63_ALKMQ|nr:HD-GYP domain-containing protein [Alkaliphilus metalliredigens]ABR46931.1 metal dependent phosphohydrolase [Alkaliphilus metalliredigens QYMF]
MRYVPIEYVTEGSFLAQPLLSPSGQVLLSRGARLTPGIVDKIKRAGFYSIYILDNISDQEIEDIIRPEVRQRAISTFRQLALVAGRDGKQTKGQQREMEKNIVDLNQLMKSVVDDIFNQKDLVMNLIDIKNIDSYTYSHSVNVMLHAVLLGVGMDLNRNQIYDLAAGSMLHDIGKIFVPEDILKKPGALSQEEYKIIQEHTNRGFSFLKEHTELSAVARIVSLQHQERVDGTGYPFKLKDKEIHTFSKITAVADVYDALISNRHYRRALPVNEALEYIMGSGGSLFDIKMVKAFVQKVNPYPIGTLVKLSNSLKGVVEDVNSPFYLRPIVKILRENGQEVKPWLSDLTKEYTLVIEDIIYEL